MRNGTLIVSVALHGVIAIAALIVAARSRRVEPPQEQLLWVDMAPPPAAAPVKPAEPLKAVEPTPRAAAAGRAPQVAARAAARPFQGGPRAGSGPPGGGQGVLAGEGGDDGFAMSAEPPGGDGNGSGVAPAAAAPPPPPKPTAAPRPKERACTDAVTKPRPIARPRSIEYPDAARADGKEGRLLLELTVGEDGSVARVDVLSGVHPALDAAAIVAVKTWRFEPASRCGKVVGGGTYRVARRFELGD